MVQQTLSPFDYGPKVCSSDHGPSMYHGDLSFTTNVDIGWVWLTLGVVIPVYPTVTEVVPRNLLIIRNFKGQVEFIDSDQEIVPVWWTLIN